MTAPVGAVFYFELKYGDSKGNVTAGDKLVKDFNRTYSSEYIDHETIGTSNGALQTFTKGGLPLAWLPVRVTKVKVFTLIAGVTTQVGADDGAGNITGAALSAGTINYTTGAISVTFNVAPAAGDVYVTYEYVSEASSNVPTVNIDIALVAVTAKSRKIKALWSSEAADDLKSLHGVNLKAA